MAVENNDMNSSLPEQKTLTPVRHETFLVQPETPTTLDSQETFELVDGNNLIMQFAVISSLYVVDGTVNPARFCTALSRTLQRFPTAAGRLRRKGDDWHVRFNLGLQCIRSANFSLHIIKSSQRCRCAYSPSRASLRLLASRASSTIAHYIICGLLIPLSTALNVSDRSTCARLANICMGRHMHANRSTSAMPPSRFTSRLRYPAMSCPIPIQTISWRAMKIHLRLLMLSSRPRMSSYMLIRSTWRPL
ncbi:hypothetical protein FA95DRAFT_1553216 [Auriscalpium vulgare]|uniref:Uncharacterized protein n=1 Tax=Auriscalpium vulgare TaxID=40419 RepID=A0ACB8SAS6_9AGAM|nr:hypothetical protein FA95DRAFT_1553216 [Auriscalpium vulgare]